MKKSSELTFFLVVALSAINNSANEHDARENEVHRANDLLEVADKCAQLWSESGWQKEDWLHWIDSHLRLNGFEPPNPMRDPGVLNSLGVIVDPVNEPRVLDVLPGSNAENAGIQRFDVIKSIDSINLRAQNTADDLLHQHVSTLSPGESVKVEVVRNGIPMDIEIDTELADDQPRAIDFLAYEITKHLSDNVSLGIVLAPSSEGISVLGVVPNSPSDIAGILAGDVLQGVDSIDLLDDERAADSFTKHISSLTPGDSVTLRVLRDEMPTEFEVTTRTDAPDVASLGVLIDPVGDGIRVIDVLQNSGADEAGVQMLDVIQGIDAIDLVGNVLTPEVLRDHVSSLTPGDAVTLRVLRGGTPMEFEVTTKSRAGIAKLKNPISTYISAYLGDDTNHCISSIDHAPAVATVVTGSTYIAETFDGNMFVNIDSDLGAYFGVTDGVLVLRASGDGGFNSGDILSTINGESVQSSAQASRLLAASKDPVIVSAIRDGVEVSIQVEPQSNTPVVRSIRKEYIIESTK